MTATPATAKQPIDTQGEKGVYLVEDKTPPMTRREAIEFFAMLRCSLLQIIRWIERHYPEAVK